MFLQTAINAVLLHVGSRVYFSRQELKSHYISLAFSLTRSIKPWHHQTCCLSGCATATAFTLCRNTEDIQSLQLSIPFKGAVPRLEYLDFNPRFGKAIFGKCHGPNPDRDKNNAIIWVTATLLTTLTSLVLSIYLAHVNPVAQFKAISWIPPLNVTEGRPKRSGTVFVYRRDNVTPLIPFMGCEHIIISVLKGPPLMLRACKQTKSVWSEPLNRVLEKKIR